MRLIASIPVLVLCLLLGSTAAPAQTAVSPAVPGACFGAAGQGCATGGGGQPAYCKPAGGQLECMVHAGSIEHDVCCAAHPQGQGCGGKPGVAADCAYEWEKSQQRTSHGLYWTRKLDPQKRNRSGIADFNALCAPAGAVVAPGDERWCCSRSASALAERDLQGINKLRCR